MSAGQCLHLVSGRRQDIRPKRDMIHVQKTDGAFARSFSNQSPFSQLNCIFKSSFSLRLLEFTVDYEGVYENIIQLQ